jgi:hypothetical protein
MRPLYGMPEEALYWFLIYFEFHKKGLGMSPTSLDSCQFFKRPESSPTAVTDSPASAELTSSTGKMPDGVVALQVGDSMICGTAIFLQMEENEVKQFQCKEGIQIVEGGEPVTFNVAEIRLENGVSIMSTHEKCRDVDADVTINTFIHFQGTRCVHCSLV